MNAAETGNSLKKLIVDIDNTLSITKDGEYENAQPVITVVEKLREYHRAGFVITLFTSRNMRTFEGNIGKINIVTLPIILGWLKKHNIPFDEVIVGKPWCGHEGFYVDDRAVRPAEFVKLTHNEIEALISEDKCF